MEIEVDGQRYALSVSGAGGEAWLIENEQPNARRRGAVFGWSAELGRVIDWRRIGSGDGRALLVAVERALRAEARQ